MKYFQTILVLFCIFPFLESCDLSESSSTPKLVRDSEGKIIEGTLIQKSPEGRLLRETVYANGLRNGISKQYYPEGTLRSEVTYVDNKQNGPARKYYKSGKLYQESEMKDGRFDGIIKKYREDGSLISTQSYRVGQPGSDLKEYSSTGEEIALKTTMTIEEIDLSNIDGFVKLRFQLSNKSRRVQFYEGQLVDGFLTDDLHKLSDERGVYEASFRTDQPEPLPEFIYVIARYTTPNNNPHLITSVYKVKAKRKYL